MDIIDANRTHYSQEEVNRKFNYYKQLVDYKLKNHQKIHDKRYHQGFFIPKYHPERCMNIMEVDEIDVITYRSGWELKFLEWLDSNEAVTRYGSEIISIVYKNLLKGKTSFYIPDMYFEYIDNQGKLQKYLIEIKPMSQAKLSEAKDGYDRLRNVVNICKWESAIKYCKKRGITFKVLTEYDLGFK